MREEHDTVADLTFKVLAKLLSSSRELFQVRTTGVKAEHRYQVSPAREFNLLGGAHVRCRIAKSFDDGSASQGFCEWYGKSGLEPKGVQHVQCKKFSY